MLKTKKEIKAELKATKKTLKNYRKAYKDGSIPRDVFENKLTACTSTIDALRWVLGKNDRYD